MNVAFKIATKLSTKLLAFIFLCFYVYSFVSILAFYLHVFPVVALCLTTLINEYEFMNTFTYATFKSVIRNTV